MHACSGLVIQKEERKSQVVVQVRAFFTIGRVAKNARGVSILSESDIRSPEIIERVNVTRMDSHGLDEPFDRFLKPVFAPKES